VLGFAGTADETVRGKYRLIVLRIMQDVPERESRCLRAALGVGIAKGSINQLAPLNEFKDIFISFHSK